MATFSSLFNAGGRVIWGAIVDRLSFKVCNRGIIIWNILSATVCKLLLGEKSRLNLLASVYGAGDLAV